MNTENNEVKDFDNFVEEISTEKNKPVEIKEKLDKNNLPEPVEGESLFCPFDGCSWKTHPNAKDKPRGLKNHMKKCKHRPTVLKKKEKKEIPEVEVPEGETLSDNSDILKDKLLGDLDLLKVKFAHIPFTWNYSSNSSIQHLKRQKALFLRVISDEAGAEAVFNLLCLGSKAVEKLGTGSGIVDLDGYAEDVRINKEEIYPILKNMVDTGVLDIGHLSPELRLGMLLTQIAITRIDHNNQNKSFLKETPVEN